MMNQDQQPQGIWLSPAIVQLDRVPAEKMLLAYICQQATTDQGVCTASNKALGEAVGIHLQTISDLVKRLQQAGLLHSMTDPSQANKRTLTPVVDFLKDYERNAYSTPADYERNTYSVPSDYQQKTDSTPSDYKQNTYSTSSDYERNADSPSATAEPTARTARFCPVTGLDITHQGINYAVVTKDTLKQLCKNDRPVFEAVLERCGLSYLRHESMSTQSRRLKYYVDQQAQTDDEADAY